MEVIGRKFWGAKHASAYQNRDAPLPADRVWLHHSVTIAPDLNPPFDDDDAAVRRLEQIGQDRFGWGMSYSFIITPIGRVYEGHRINGLGAHTGGQNSTSRAICLVGNYDERYPTRQQIHSAAQLLVWGAHPDRRWWRHPQLAGGHRDAPGATTACPGRHAHAAIATINQLASVGTAASEVDVPLTDQEIERIARRTAELTSQSVWSHPVQNVKGEWPSAAGVLVATEGRAWDTQDRAYEIRDDVRSLPDHMTAQSGGVDLEALADLIIARMAARMGGT
jgi:hypothetical protein